MSRNFELLAKIESELDKDVVLEPVFTDRAAKQGFVLIDHSDDYQEEIVRLVQRVFLSSSGNVPRKVVFCGVEDENGSTSVCADSARALAASTCQSVCLVDGNLRSSKLTDHVGVADPVSIFAGVPSKDDGCIQIKSNLWFGPTDLLSDGSSTLAPIDGLRERLNKLHGIFDFLLVDAPGTNAGEDATKLGQLADAVILVIEANRTRKLTARKAIETLEASGVKLLGTVLRARSFPIPERIYKWL